MRRPEGRFAPVFADFAMTYLSSPALCTRTISDVTEPSGSRRVGIADKIDLLIKMLEQLYPLGDRPQNSR